MTNREIVIPGEIVREGDGFLPGEGTTKREGKVIAQRFGLAEEQNNLIKVIPLSGVYIPRRGNSVIGKVENITHNGWVIDIGASENGFLSLMEVPKYVNKDNLEEVLDIGDMVVAKIAYINKRGIDLTLKSRGLGKINEGIIFEVNPHKVPRIIGKEGSMINLIKEKTDTNITVGQNGFVWIKSENIENELKAKEAIMFVVEKSFIDGLTDEVNKFFEEMK
jgi:exosome complex component RRP4